MSERSRRLIKALIDPALLVPPKEPAPVRAWLSLLRGWYRLLSDAGGTVVVPIMSEESQAALAQATGGVTGISSALAAGGASHYDAPSVYKLIEGIRARAVIPSGAGLEPSEVVFAQLKLDPAYASERVATDIPFPTDVGHLGLACNQAEAGVASTTDSWASAEEHVAIEGEVDLWEREDETCAPDSEERLVSTSLPLWCDIERIDGILREHWPLLLPHPSIGIEVAYREITPNAEERRAHPLKYKLGQRFVSSLIAMGYEGQPGRIAATFRMAAFIASGRSGEPQSLEARPFRKTAIATSAPLTRQDGAKMMRGTLGTGPAANRIMWWEGAEPVLLGVVGHDDDPGPLAK